MAKTSLLILFWLLGLVAQAQFGLKGRVVDENTNEPLAFVSVFVNTTTIGTQTNNKGEFTLKIPAGKNDLIVSLVGYEPIIYQVDTGKPLPPLLFKLTSGNQVLNEVTVTAKRDSTWYQNLAVFKEAFLGKSRVASQCKLLNPETLVISFDPETSVLDVRARDMLQIENPVLGYRLKYLLVHFKYNLRDSYISYAGYPNYEPMRGNQLKEKRWQKSRQVAFKGSVMHFVRALRLQKLEQEGFNLRRLVRYPNPDRPPEAEIERVRAELRQYGAGFVLKQDDPRSIILSKARLPKFLERLDTSRVAYNTYLQRNPGNEIKMSFKNLFQVVYTGEKEEVAYAQSAVLFHPRKPTYQTSVLYLNTESVSLEELGNITPPLDCTFEGYWAWEKVGDMLPLDYISTDK